DRCRQLQGSAHCLELLSIRQGRTQHHVRGELSVAPLLLLDEPTEGIQPSIVLEIRRVLRRIRDQTEVAMLLAEQFLDFATDLADEYCVLDGCGVALASSAAELDKAAVHELLAV